MADKQQKQRKVIAMSPVGTLAYTWIAKPDAGYKNKDADNPKYKTTVLIPKEGAHEEAVTVRYKDTDGKWQDSSLEELCSDFAAEVWGKAPRKLAYMGVKDGDEFAEDKEKPEFADHWMIEAKSKFKPKQYDAAKQEVAEAVNAGSGDLARISFTLYAYGEGAKRGISLQLRTIQIIEKRAGGSMEGSADDFDDEEFEDGYVTDVDAPAGEDADDESAY